MIQEHLEDFGLIGYDRPINRPLIVHVLHRGRLGICALVEQRPGHVHSVILNAGDERIVARLGSRLQQGIEHGAIASLDGVIQFISAWGGFRSLGQKKVNDIGLLGLYRHQKWRKVVARVDIQCGSMLDQLAGQVIITERRRNDERGKTAGFPGIDRSLLSHRTLDFIGIALGDCQQQGLIIFIFDARENRSMGNQHFYGRLTGGTISLGRKRIGNGQLKHRLRTFLIGQIGRLGIWIRPLFQKTVEKIECIGR